MLIAVPGSALIGKLGYAFLLTVGAYGLHKSVLFFWANWTSPLRRLPGPPSPNFIWGHLKDIYEAEVSVLHEKWVKEYGRTLTYRGLFGTYRFFSTDPKAVNHILTNHYVYQKPASMRYGLSQMLGDGLVVVEGDNHKRQRRIMNPAFGDAHIRELTDIFVQKSIELRDVWTDEVQSQGQFGVVNVLGGLSRMTLDVIGLAGFNYEFNALAEGEDASELNRAFAKVFEGSMSPSLIPLIKAFLTPLRWIPGDRDAETQQAKRTMDRIGKELLEKSKAELSEAGGLEKDSLRSKDLLTLLLKANMATDVPEHQKMSDADVLAQVPTFLVAGHESTSTATTWALFALSKAPRVQQKLREELLAVPNDHITMDELNALPYLDAVVRESLRIHSPVPATIRVAVEDDLLPLDSPVRGKDGKLHEFVEIRKGQTIILPILAMNRDESIWGDDCLEFRPERWYSVPDDARAIPGVWGNLMTFLGGPRGCIGHRFSVIEMKALLFTLVKGFEFEPAVPVEDVGTKTALVQRPFLKSNPKAGNQMPLRVKPYTREYS